MSAYYALRLYQRTMHNRKPDGLESREIGWRDGVVLAPLVLCILGLALYPQLILKRTDTSVAGSVAATEGPSGGSPQNTQHGAVNSHGRTTCAAPRSCVLGDPLTPPEPTGPASELPRASHRLRRPFAGPGADRRPLRRPAQRRLQATAPHGARPDPDHARRHSRPADLAVERHHRPRLRLAAPRRPGDLDLTDRDPHRRFCRLSRSASPPPDRSARASTTRC